MIYTFYSFKGGVGRSMALANLAELFYAGGLNVLMIDFDLEAPGLERYFPPSVGREAETSAESSESRDELLAHKGIMDMLVAYKDVRSLLSISPNKPAASQSQVSAFFAEPLADYCATLKQSENAGNKLQLITAGRRDAHNFSRYTRSIQSFNWRDFYLNQEGEAFFDRFRTEVQQLADIVLIDSRTGITEMGGTCTHQLADCVLLFVGANQQNIDGTLKIAKSLSSSKLIQGRKGRPLKLLPIPSRIENTEATSLNHFSQQFQRRLEHLVPKNISFEEDFFTDLKIPYIAYYAYQERVAVREQEDSSAKDMVKAFRRIAQIMAGLAPEGVIKQKIQTKRGIEVFQNIPTSGVVRFVGRQSELEGLQQALENNRLASQRALEPSRAVAIVGTAGVGKTELAIQYARQQYESRYYTGGICWIERREGDKERAVDVVDQVLEFAREHLELNPPADQTDEENVRYVWNHWSVSRSLIVVDAVADYSAIAPYLPTDYAQFDILLTTRQDLGEAVQPFPIQELSRNGAVDLLNSLADALNISDQVEQVWKLCERVGYLPLALDMIGRALGRMSQPSIDSVLESVETHSLDEGVLKEPVDNMTARLGVSKALSLSWQTLEDSEKTLACLLSLFAPRPIPWHMVEQCAIALNLESLEQIRDRGLMAKSLLTRIDSEHYQLHRLVRDFAHMQLQSQADEGEAIRAAFRQGLIEVAHTLASDSHNQIVSAHVIAHLQVLVNQMREQLSDAEKIEIFSILARFYATHGEYAKAEPWYEQELEVLRRTSEDDPEAIAQVLNKLAAIYYEQKKYDQAEPLYQEALEKRKSVFTAVDPKVADVMDNLAILHNTQKNYDEAEKLFREVLAIRRQSQDEAYARSLNNIATFYDLTGDAEQAEVHYLESLKLNRQVLGAEHPNVASSLYNLAELYRTQRKYNESAALYRESLTLREKHLGAEHPDTKLTARRLEMLYEIMRRY